MLNYFLLQGSFSSRVYVGMGMVQAQTRAYAKRSSGF